MPAAIAPWLGSVRYAAAPCEMVGAEKPDDFIGDLRGG